MPISTEGRIPFIVGEEGFETYYKVVGDLAGCAHGPLVVLHGGPSISHDYLIPLADLTERSPSRAVILYDQLSSGQSTRLRTKDISFWTIDLFIAELENLLDFFGVTECFNILGHSWGGTLASEFITRPGLPDAGTTKTAEYKAAMMVFWAKHGCRVQPFPPEFLHSISLPDEDSTVLDAMRNGSVGLGTRWDITDRIPLMRHVPTLIINGEHDMMDDSVCGPFFRGIDRVKWVKFAHSSHSPQWEERDRYIDVVGGFLDQV
ncbi:proline-specific peptidase, partial [Mycena metata]